MERPSKMLKFSTLLAPQEMDCNNTPICALPVLAIISVILVQFIKRQNLLLILFSYADHVFDFFSHTQEAINRVQELQAEGRLTGVIDDRGKFIYISEEELEAVAKFIRQRGRVSIAELAEASNQLISLNPENKEVYQSKLLSQAV
nr:DDRGK domain-containing protein 1-like [Lytechinus pictus]